MSNIAKTISYLKRNGIMDTWYAVRERTDRKHMDEMSRFMAQYTGRERLPKEEIKRQQDKHFEREYLISILVPAYETDEKYMRQLLESVLLQTYAQWELIIADASHSNQVEQVVKSYRDERIIYHRLKDNKGISENTNEALRLAKGDYIGLLDHDDILEKDALYEIMCKLQESEYALIYSDEDKMDAECSRFYEPHIKPDFNLDLLLSNNYICHFLIMKRELMQELGFRAQMDGAQDYDLVLRAVAALIEKETELTGDRQKVMTFMHRMLADKIGHVPKVLYHWRCHEDSTAANPESKRYAYDAGLKALEDFIGKMKWDADVCHSKHLGFYHIVYRRSIWEVRPDVAAIGGNISRNHIITASPSLDGKELFVGMHDKYSGYMHRAAMYMDVDELVVQSCFVRPNLTLSAHEARKQGMCLLYAPDFKGN